MRPAVLALSILAVANIVAVLAFVGWLRATDRLSPARIERVRQIFVPTLAQERAREDADAAKASADRAQAERAARLSKPAVTSEMELAARVETTELDRQRQQRLRDEVAQLQAAISAKLGELEALRAKVGAARQEFEDLTRATRELASDQQFRKSLAVLEAMKPAQAKTALKEVLGGSEGAERAVAYLNAMDEGVRAKVLQEFLKDDPKVAAELLEALRTRGVPPPAPGVPAK